MLASSVWRGVERSWFYGGLLVGSAITATVAVLAGSVIRPLLATPVRVGLLVAAVAFVVLGELGAHRRQLPHAARQVRQWIAGEGASGAFQFGVEMGTGVRTFSTSNLPHLALVVLLLFPEPVSGLLAGVGFAAGRALMTLSRSRSPDRAAWDAGWLASERRVRRLLAVAATLALVAALGAVSPLNLHLDLPVGRLG